MGEISIQQQQKYALEALKIVDKVFKDNGIKYILLAGSCLGAVRQDGFIPWDDDIDIGVFQEDYERVKVLLSENLGKEFSWAYVDKQNKFPRFHGKVLRDGIGCLDVFPLVRTSNNGFMRRFQWIIRKYTFKTYKAKLSYRYKHEDGDFKELIKRISARFFSFFVSTKFIMKLKSWNDGLYQGKETNYCINMYSVYSLKRELIRKEWIFPIQSHIFEQCEFPVVNDTDNYLRNLYGNDYMTPKKYGKKARHDETFLIEN